MNRDTAPTVEISVEVMAEREKAILVTDGKVEAWIPRSMILDYCEDRGSIVSIFLSEYFAEEKGLL